MRPFATINEAMKYGVAAEDQAGGWWGIDYQAHPNGTDFWHVGRPDGENARPDAVEERSGWPKTLRYRHLLIRTHDARSSKCIVREDPADPTRWFAPARRLT